MTTNNKGLMSKIEVKALITGFFVLAILSPIAFMIENYYFWRRVSEVYMLTGAASSFEIGKQVAREPKIVIMGLLSICISYSIAVYIVLIGRKQFILTNAVVFGLVAVMLANIIKAIWNIKSVVDYPWITLLEITVALIICTVIGYFIRLKVKKTNEAT